MVVIVLKPVDSVSYGRIIQKGEVVDLPIDADSWLITKGYVAPSSEDLTAEVPAVSDEDDERRDLLNESDLEDN